MDCKTPRERMGRIECLLTRRLEACDANPGTPGTPGSPGSLGPVRLWLRRHRVVRSALSALVCWALLGAIVAGVAHDMRHTDRTRTHQTQETPDDRTLAASR